MILLALLYSRLSPVLCPLLFHQDQGALYCGLSLQPKEAAAILLVLFWIIPSGLMAGRGQGRGRRFSGRRYENVLF